MKRKLSLLILLCLLSLLILPSCDAREAGSIKTLTNSYIAQYECTEAHLGDENILDKFDYIIINLKDKKKLELIYKPLNGDKRVIESEYTFDNTTHELTAEIGILGYSVKQSTKIEHGKFTVCKQFGGKELIMKFKAK